MLQFQFESLSDLLSMSGHGPYVWLAYAVGLLALLYLVAFPAYQKRRFMKQQQALIRRQRAQQSAASQEAQ